MFVSLIRLRRGDGRQGVGWRLKSSGGAAVGNTWNIGKAWEYQTPEQRALDSAAVQSTWEYRWPGGRDSVPPGEYNLLWDTYRARLSHLDTIAGAYLAAGRGAEYWNDYLSEHIAACTVLVQGLKLWQQKYAYEVWAEKQVSFWGRREVFGAMRHTLREGDRKEPRARKWAARWIVKTEAKIAAQNVAKGFGVPLPVASAVVAAAGRAGAGAQVLTAAQRLIRVRSQVAHVWRRRPRTVRAVLRFSLPAWAVMLWTAVVAAAMLFLR